MLDGHRSAMVAPDHLLYHGLTKRLVGATFKLLSESRRNRVAISIREALAHSHFPTTSVYNAKRRSIVSIGISEWAATLTVFKAVLKRTLRSATHREGAEMTPLMRAMNVVCVYKDLVTSVYFCPRIDLDGGVQCRTRLTAVALQQRAEEFFSLVRSACLRADMAGFGAMLDAPNLHRLRELMDHVIPALLHVRHAQELLFENAHQQLKRAVVSSNGHEDAARALSRYLLAEVASRMKACPSVFALPDDWLEHPGVRACLSRCHPLFSVDTAEWRCAPQTLSSEEIPLAARMIATPYCGSPADVRWHRRATRPPTEGLSVGDAVAVLILPQLSLTAVPVARGAAANQDDASTAFFCVQAFFVTRSGAAGAVVCPYDRDDAGAFWRVRTHSYFFLALEFARRALVLHDCDCRCPTVCRRVVHTQTNRWLLFGRRAGYPARSG